MRLSLAAAVAAASSFRARPWACLRHCMASPDDKVDFRIRPTGWMRYPERGVRLGELVNDLLCFKNDLLSVSLSTSSFWVSRQATALSDGVDERSTDEAQIGLLGAGWAVQPLPAPRYPELVDDVSEQSPLPPPPPPCPHLDLSTMVVLVICLKLFKQ